MKVIATIFKIIFLLLITTIVWYFSLPILELVAASKMLNNTQYSLWFICWLILCGLIIGTITYEVLKNE